MKRICGILTASLAVGLFGCATDNMSGSASTDQNMTKKQEAMTYGAHDTAAANPSKVTATPQLRSGSDKTELSVALSESDRLFILDAAAAGQYEVSAGEKALAKSSDARVKALAQRIVDDHTKTNDQLKSLAQRKGVEISALPTADQVSMLAQLDKLSGSEFDREYLTQQTAAHKDAIAKFQVAATSGTDRDTREWASATLPALRDHLRMITNDSTNVNLGAE